MRHISGAIAMNLLLAQDRMERERRAADEWRRFHARPDAEPDPVGETTGGPGVVGRLVGGLVMRLSAATARRGGVA